MWEACNNQTAKPAAIDINLESKSNDWVENADAKIQFSGEEQLDVNYLNGR